jgi:phosphoglycerol transferase MdoB-like AlkP superfamily enzyme
MDYLSNNKNINSSPPKWWRWPLIPFACVIGSVLGAMAMGLIQWFGMKMSGGYSEDGWYFLYILPIITSATLGYLWVKISFYVAPSGKKTTAIIMTALLAAILILVTALSLINPNYSASENAQSILGGIAMMLASICAIINLEN